LSESIVEITGLRKVYGGKNPVVAVDDIDLKVGAGLIYGLLGPNGAGKTTTISIATTRAIPTAGSVVIDGVDVVADPALARRSAAGWRSGCRLRAPSRIIRRCSSWTSPARALTRRAGSRCGRPCRRCAAKASR